LKWSLKDTHSNIFSSSEDKAHFNFSLKMSKRSNKDREEHGDKRVKVTAPHETVEGI